MYLQERSSAKRKQLFKDIQTKSGVSNPIQLLLDMAVRWSSTYMIISKTRICFQELCSTMECYIVTSFYTAL
jgi:hypothetical protein